MTKKKTYEEVNSFLENLGWKLLQNKYVSSKEKMKCLCPNLHLNYKSFESFVAGDGCINCRNDALKYNNEKVKDIFLRDNNILLDDYIDSTTHMRVLCPSNHEYTITLNKFNSGRRCPFCFRKRFSESMKNHFVDISGKRFGKLTAIARVLSNDGISWWECVCDCEKECTVRYSSLAGGLTKSCGCLGNESFIAIELKKYILDKYKSQEEYSIFRNPKTNYPLPYDIYIFGGENISVNGVYVEIHGKQHYKLSGWHTQQSKNRGTTPEEEFEYQKHKDRLKRRFARKHGTYIEIDLRKIKTVEQTIEYVESILKTLL